MKNKKDKQKGALGIDAYVGLMVVIFSVLIMMAGLGGMARLMDARADIQQVANFVGQRYRDEGCISVETRDMVRLMMTETKMPAGSVTVSGAATTPLPYGQSTMITLRYHYTLIDWDGWGLSGDIPVPMPIYSQYSPQVLSQQPSCVTSL